jgi:hypothetical protein
MKKGSKKEVNSKMGLHEIWAYINHRFFLPGSEGLLLLPAELDCKELAIVFPDLVSIVSIFREIFRR